MIRQVVAALAGSALLVAITEPAAAHHSFAAEFDANKPVTLHGTITKLEWINPHSWLHVDVKNDDGTTTEWMVEARDAEYVAAPRLHARHRQGRHRDHGRRLPGEERRASRERPRSDPRGRRAIVHGLLGKRSLRRRC